MNGHTVIAFEQELMGIGRSMIVMGRLVPTVYRIISGQAIVDARLHPVEIDPRHILSTERY